MCSARWNGYRHRPMSWRRPECLSRTSSARLHMQVFCRKIEPMVAWTVFGLYMSTQSGDRYTVRSYSSSANVHPAPSFSWAWSVICSGSRYYKRQGRQENSVRPCLLSWSCCYRVLKSRKATSPMMLPSASLSAARIK